MPFLFVLTPIWSAAPDPHPELVGAIQSTLGNGIEEGKNATAPDMAVRYCAVETQLELLELVEAYDSASKVAGTTTRKAMGTAAAYMEG